MTINEIINLLKKDGVNSKLLVTQKLERLNYEDLLELRQDINERINKLNEKERT